MESNYSNGHKNLMQILVVLANIIHINLYFHVCADSSAWPIPRIQNTFTELTEPSLIFDDRPYRIPLCCDKSNNEVQFSVTTKKEYLAEICESLPPVKDLHCQEFPVTCDKEFQLKMPSDSVLAGSDIENAVGNYITDDITIECMKLFSLS